MRIFPFALIPLFLVALLLPAAQASEGPGGLLESLRGEPAPGALLIGKTAPGTRVQLDSKALAVTEEGYFVFGFGRDDEGPASLTLRHGDDTSRYDITLAARSWDIQRIEGVPQRTVTPPAEALARISEEASQVTAARNTSSSLTGFREDFIWPVRGRITGVYGSQRIFNGEPRRPHYGVDIAAPTGTPIQAPASGQVTLVHDDMFYSGGTLIIDHGLGVSSTYLHMSEILVAEGDSVTRGDIIGKVGATGRATGPHLCWRLNWYQERLDPRTLTGEM